jgi:hypothetical protein
MELNFGYVARLVMIRLWTNLHKVVEQIFL